MVGSSRCDRLVTNVREHSFIIVLLDHHFLLAANEIIVGMISYISLFMVYSDIKFTIHLPCYLGGEIHLPPSPWGILWLDVCSLG